jgi:hypothetical protein
MITHKSALRQTGLGPQGKGRAAAGLTALLLTACAAMPLHASDLQPLTIALVESSGDKYVEPDGRRIVIRSQPMRLFIRIRNTSESAVLVRVLPEKACSIELKDEAGLTSMVTREKVVTGGESDDNRRVDLSPGADKIIPMLISRDTWDGLPELEPGKERKYTARAVYETADGQIVYSEPYALTFSIWK